MHPSDPSPKGPGTAVKSSNSVRFWRWGLGTESNSLKHRQHDFTRKWDLGGLLPPLASHHPLLRPLANPPKHSALENSVLLGPSTIPLPAPVKAKIAGYVFNAVGPVLLVYLECVLCQAFLVSLCPFLHEKGFHGTASEKH